MTDKKLKVAFLLSGQPRFIDGMSYDSIFKNILTVYDCDVFIHCWFSSDKNYKYETAKWSGINKELNIPLDTIDILNRLYNPKDFLWESPKEFVSFHLDDCYLSRNMPSMFYSLQKSYELMKNYRDKNGIKYDFIIRCRTDTLIKSLPHLSTLDKNTLYIPDNCPNKELVNDNFSICGGDIRSNCIYSIFDKLFFYSRVVSKGEEKKDIFGVYRQYNPEEIWTFHLKSSGINYQKTDCISQTFVRS